MTTYQLALDEARRSARNFGQPYGVLGLAESPGQDHYAAELWHPDKHQRGDYAAWVDPSGREWRSPVHSPGVVYRSRSRNHRIVVRRRGAKWQPAHVADFADIGWATDLVNTYGWPELVQDESLNRFERLTDAIEAGKAWAEREHLRFSDEMHRDELAAEERRTNG